MHVLSLELLFVNMEKNNDIHTSDPHWRSDCVPEARRVRLDCRVTCWLTSCLCVPLLQSSLQNMLVFENLARCLVTVKHPSQVFQLFPTGIVELFDGFATVEPRIKPTIVLRIATEQLPLCFIGILIDTSLDALE
jgi:hypothetical protein